jgi:hypothetical protein
MRCGFERAIADQPFNSNNQDTLADIDTLNVYKLKISAFMENSKNKALNYEDYVQGIDALEPEEQLSLVELLSARLREHLANKTSAKRSITELDGLGADIWDQVDIESYIQKERNAWD